mmetsp:Transcript_35446/g.77637  ORF Transcript_35446/g.77637 Transcript_35446/m.77637 type:complete len:209 (-) Transcript_35446:773-1399(-)
MHNIKINLQTSSCPALLLRSTRRYSAGNKVRRVSTASILALANLGKLGLKALNIQQCHRFLPINPIILGRILLGLAVSLAAGRRRGLEFSISRLPALFALDCRHFLLFCQLLGLASAFIEKVLSGIELHIDLGRLLCRREGSVNLFLLLASGSIGSRIRATSLFNLLRLNLHLMGLPSLNVLLLKRWQEATPILVGQLGILGQFLHNH